MTDAKIIALFASLEVADKIINALNLSPLGDISCEFHGLETFDDESDDEADVFAMVIRVEVKKK